MPPAHCIVKADSLLAPNSLSCSFLLLAYVLCDYGGFRADRPDRHGDPLSLVHPLWFLIVPAADNLIIDFMSWVQLCKPTRGNGEYLNPSQVALVHLKPALLIPGFGYQVGAGWVVFVALFYLGSLHHERHTIKGEGLL